MRQLSIYAGEMQRGQTPFSVERNTLLVRIASRRDSTEGLEDKDRPHGKVLALVVGGYDPAQTDGRGQPVVQVGPDGRVLDGAGRPVTAYTIVVSYQFAVRGRDNAAADLAADIVRLYVGPRMIAADGRFNGG